MRNNVIGATNWNHHNDRRIKVRVSNYVLYVYLSKNA